MPSDGQPSCHARRTGKRPLGDLEPARFRVLTEDNHQVVGAKTSDEGLFSPEPAACIGRRLVVLLRNAGHDVVGTTRSETKAAALQALGATAAVVDVV